MRLSFIISLLLVIIAIILYVVYLGEDKSAFEYIPSYNVQVCYFDGMSDPNKMP
jgi:uncharacterized membrane protein